MKSLLGSETEVGDVRPLFPVELRPITRPDASSYDMSGVGQRFLVNAFVQEAPTNLHHPR